MKVLIIEDEILSAKKIVDYLDKYNPGFNVVDRLDSVESSLKWFSINPHPDLVFLDIHLSDGICFDIFKNTEIHSPVIFTTAHDKYAIRAFRLNSIDYLLKPIKYDAFAEALDKFLKLSGKNYPQDLGDRIKGLLDDISKEETVFRTRFLVKKGQYLQYIESSEVAYFFSDTKVTFLVSGENIRYTIDHSLDTLEEQLDPKYFFRANRKYLIRINALESIHPYFKGRLKIKLKLPFKEEIIISSEKAQQFKKWLDQ